MNLLHINDLHVNFSTKAGQVRVLSGFCLDIEKGSSICLVGESGCGKTIVALSIMRLLPENAQVSGEIQFKDRDLLILEKEEIRQIRGHEISMIFEQPASCLNPVFTVGDQIAESVRANGLCKKNEARDAAIELMRLTGIPSPKKRFDQYPHEFSGGMLQRVMISIAMASKPALLIADEPTTSLDVTVQAQIVELIKDLITKFGMSLLLITHDLGVAAELCRDVAVMYAGEIVESGCLNEVFRHPKHPYTKALLRAISDDGLRPIKGSVPELTNLPEGCWFHPRCPFAEDQCRLSKPELKNGIRCHLWKKN
ncbi:MAG: Trehalose/maltose import ATP-binding protein MalK [Methanosaeta sp. PtaU1.Bin060]|jgi:oligopeptide/dipeptide ABC transporter ATP-binding protein|nr:MAG: Trehalose/maltose import ATP-binding protein MalK [Methanosaeta sp. PtaU1.Bin060]